MSWALSVGMVCQEGLKTKGILSIYIGIKVREDPSPFFAVFFLHHILEEMCEWRARLRTRESKGL